MPPCAKFALAPPWADELPLRQYRKLIGLGKHGRALHKRLRPAGNWQLSHAVQLAEVAQIRWTGSAGQD
jgi:hypothetical protein